MENKKVTLNDLANDLDELNKSIERSNKYRKEFIDLLKQKSKKQKIPDEIIIHYDFQMW